MKKIFTFLALYVETPSDYLYHGSDPKPISWAFYQARKHGLRGPLSLLADINLVRERNGVPLVDVLLG